MREKARPIPDTPYARRIAEEWTQRRETEPKNATEESARERKVLRELEDEAE